ncbi:MAG: outer membrane beta-barrel protein [Elusimicrobiaceae bacterium]|nr:outer membrane beta-barrel protein [Elusimicrobiaceae bacterium]
MKKIVVLLGILLCGTGVSFAQSGLEVGNGIISASLGVANAINDVEGHGWGDHGAFAYGVQGIGIVAPYIGVGLEIAGNNFASVTSKKNSLQTEVNADIWNLMLAGRIYLSSMESQTRLYVPVGLGLGFSDIDIKFAGTLYENSSDTSFVYYAGIGFEDEIGENFLFGFEARYHGGTSAEVELLNDDYSLRYITVAARLGYKF